MLARFCAARKDVTERAVVGPGIPRLLRQMATGMTSHADLGLAAQNLACLAYVPVLLSEVNPICLEPPSECNAVVDDKSHVAFTADRLQRLRKPRCLVLIDIHHPILEFSHWTGIKRARQPLRKSA